MNKPYNVRFHWPKLFERAKKHSVRLCERNMRINKLLLQKHLKNIRNIFWLLF